MGSRRCGYALFVPLFFVYVGIEAHFQSVGHVPLLLLAGFIAIAIVTKVVGCGGGALMCRFNAHEALTVGVGMVSRGEVALITASIGLQAGLITSSLFSIVILISLVTTLITPLLLKLVYLIPSSSCAYNDGATTGDFGRLNLILKTPSLWVCNSPLRRCSL